MRFFVVVLSCFLAAVSAENKKISLEDIERDNVKNEKRTTAVKPPAGSPTDFGFLPVKTASDYARQQPKEAYVQPHYIPQHYTPPPQRYSTIPQQQYYYQQQQVQEQPHSNLYQQYENVQYVTDNSINNQQSQHQQYYTHQPQYVYLQQYTAPSTAVQTVVDPKAGLQYVMYIPTTYVQRAEQSQNLENVVYATDAAAPETQYVIPQVPSVTPGIQYAEEQPAPEVVKPKFYATKEVYTTKKEPKSLLDSYVPSILQVQYYKQQEQARANVIQQSLKSTGPVVGKVDYVKSYRPVHAAESIVNYNYQIPRVAYHK